MTPILLPFFINELWNGSDPGPILGLFFGTGMGIIVGTFIFTFFVSTFKEVWASGHWEDLFSFKIFFSIGLFVFSLFILRIVKKPKKEN